LLALTLLFRGYGHGNPSVARQIFEKGTMAARVHVAIINSVMVMADFLNGFLQKNELGTVSPGSLLSYWMSVFLLNHP
jgi:hypothetical protein